MPMSSKDWQPDVEVEAVAPHAGHLAAGLVVVLEDEHAVAALARSVAATSPAIPAPTTIASGRPSAASTRVPRARSSSHVAVKSRARTSARGRSSDTVRQPVRNIAGAQLRDEPAELRLDRVSTERSAARRSGSASATASAPSASAFAISIPFRMPPEAMTTRSPGRRGRSTMLSEVGIPSARRARPGCAAPGRSARRLSILDQEVPPTPGGLDAGHRELADLLRGPARDAGAHLLQQDRHAHLAGSTARSFGRRAEKRVSPSGWIASWSGFRWNANASQPTPSTSRRSSRELDAVVELHRAEVPEEEREVGRGLADRVGVRERRDPGACFRCEPSAKPTPQRAAARASRRFISPARGVPPVIAPTTSGAASRLPRSVDAASHLGDVHLGQRVVLEAQRGEAARVVRRGARPPRRGEREVAVLPVESTDMAPSLISDRTERTTLPTVAIESRTADGS